MTGTFLNYNLNKGVLFSSTRKGMTVGKKQYQPGQNCGLRMAPFPNTHLEKNKGQTGFASQKEY
jgi:hypothetical protein